MDWEQRGEKLLQGYREYLASIELNKLDALKAIFEPRRPDFPQCAIVESFGETQAGRPIASILRLWALYRVLPAAKPMFLQKLRDSFTAEAAAWVALSPEARKSQTEFSALRRTVELERTLFSQYRQRIAEHLPPSVTLEDCEKELRGVLAGTVQPAPVRYLQLIESAGDSKEALAAYIDDISRSESRAGETLAANSAQTAQRPASISEYAAPIISLVERLCNTRLADLQRTKEHADVTNRLICAVCNEAPEGETAKAEYCAALFRRIAGVLPENAVSYLRWLLEVELYLKLSELQFSLSQNAGQKHQKGVSPVVVTDTCHLVQRARTEIEANRISADTLSLLSERWKKLVIRPTPKLKIKVLPHWRGVQMHSVLCAELAETIAGLSP